MGPAPCKLLPKEDHLGLNDDGKFISKFTNSINLYLVINLSIYLSIYLSIHLSIYLSIYLIIYLYIYLSIDLSIHRSIYIYLSTHLCICPSLHASIYVSIDRDIQPYFCIFIKLSICMRMMPEQVWQRSKHNNSNPYPSKPIWPLMHMLNKHAIPKQRPDLLGLPHCSCLSENGLPKNISPSAIIQYTFYC